MKHTACTHPATPAGRAACRKANAPEAKEQADYIARRDAVCQDCLNYAYEPAWENLRDLYMDRDGMSHADADMLANENYMREAVRYVEENISTPCAAHEARI